MHNVDTHFMARRDALSRHQRHAEWLRTQEDVWRQRTADYGRLQWVSKQDFIDQMVEFCEPSPHWLALDVGTGPGIIASAVRPRVARVIGVDLAPEMAEAAVAQHGAGPARSGARSNPAAVSCCAKGCRPIT
jgi:protein-L-isoaspartate O-methyltransferase